MMPYCHLCGAEFEQNAVGRKRFLCDGCRFPIKRTDIQYGALTMPYIDHLETIAERHGIRNTRDLSVAIGLNYRYIENIIYRLQRIPITNVSKETISKMEKWERIFELGDKLQTDLKTEKDVLRRVKEIRKKRGISIQSSTRH